jgi:hypothetical protein
MAGTTLAIAVAIARPAMTAEERHNQEPPI